jgi:peroxiredoxin
MTKTSVLLILFAFVAGSRLAAAHMMTPQMGDTAPNFTLRTLDERAVELKALTAKAPVVLVVLRGWPGYQCPMCTKQVHDFVANAAEFKARGAQVVMVYPGPAEKLQAHAQEFLQDKSWPADFTLVLDPDYAFTKAYGLRWEAKNETAYPSTFVIGREGKIESATISKSHGGRVSAKQALAALK